MYFTTRKALVAAVLSCALIAAFASPGTADSKSDLRKKKDQVSGKIGNAKKNLESSSRAYANAAAALKRAQVSLDAAQSHLSETKGELAVAHARDAAMQAELNRSEASLKQAQVELSDGKKSLQISELEVQQFTVESLQEGDRGLRAFGELLRGVSPSTFSEQINLNNSVGDAQLATMQQLAAKKVLLTLNEAKVKQLRDEVAAKRAQAAANLVTRTKLTSQARTQTARVNKLVGVRTAAAKSANAAKQDDARQLQSLENERYSLESRLRALARQELAKRRANGGGNVAGGDGGGTLSYAADGPITSQYGMRFHPILHVWKLHDGTDFGVPCGTPVRAAASGTILQEYYNAGYGNRIILNNGIMRGQSVVTTYNHLSRFVAGPGQRVSRGQLIGYSGTTGYSTGCHLHFMVIVNGVTVNPMGWL